MKKVISILFILIILIMLYPGIALAGNSPDAVIGAVGKITWQSVNMTRIAGQVLSIVQVVGSIAAAVMLVVIAIKYMTAAPSDKADVKKQVVGYFIGVVIIAAVITLLSIFSAIGDRLSGLA